MKITKDQIKILLAEDDTIIGEIVTTALTEIGYIIDWVIDGTQAVEKLQCNQYTVILLDFNLPRLSGVQLIEQCRMITAETPIVTLSAQADKLHKQRCFNAGVNKYLAKPFSLQELDSLITNLSQ